MNLFRKLANRTTPIDETALHYIWLSLACGFASAAARELISAYHGAGAVYAEEDFSSRTDLSEPLRKRLSEKDLSDAQEIYKACREKGIGILTYESDLYPSRLRTLTNPPAVLYYRGRITNLDCEPCVAVVGTRSVSRYGEEVTDWFGYELAKSGAFVVSGLAKGVDAAASRGALLAGGVPVAVTGSGLDVYYPAENRDLYEDIAAAGVLLSEYPPGTEPDGRHFPVRNRILSGLSVATLVVEAPARSGALITAGTALEQGRDVFAVPGPIDAPTSAGCNRLIQEGAGLVTDAWDILREYADRFPAKLRREELREPPRTLGYQARQERKKPEPKAVPPALDLTGGDLSLTDDQIALLRLLDSEEPILADDLIEKSGIPTRRVLSALTVLEIDNLVRQHSGKRYTRTVTLKE